jgi:hypothetical protein
MWMTHRKTYQEIKDRYIGLLSLPEAELHAYWLSNVAVNYWHGSYLDRATERSKKMLFNRWKKFIAKYVTLPCGVDAPSWLGV